MKNRKQKIEELVEGFQMMKRKLVFKSISSGNLPRITPSQWGALLMIGDGKANTVRDLAKALCITSSATTQLVDGLVQSKYVIRKEDPKDRRTVRLSLSQNTKTKVDKMKKEILSKFSNFFSVLSDKEFEAYCSIMAKIVGKL